MRCPACNGAMMLIGILGNTRHLRCRMCGMEAHEPIPTVDPIERLIEQGRAEFVGTVDELTCDGDHQPHEDCMICVHCGQCTESLNEEDECSECVTSEEDKLLTIYDRIVQWYLEEEDLKLQDIDLTMYPQLEDWFALLNGHLLSPKGTLKSFAQALRGNIERLEELIEVVLAYEKEGSMGELTCFYNVKEKMMKIEMALLYEDWWELVVIEIPAIYSGRPYHLIDLVGRQAIMAMPEYADIRGCYCFNEMYG